MSHYTVGVIIPKEFKEEELRGAVEGALEPFDENLEVEEYVAYTKEEIECDYEQYAKRMIENKEEPVSYQEFAEDYTSRGLDDEGNALSIYNPDSKWDWYVIGGRWNNEIETKSGKKVNYARIKDIKFEVELTEEELAQAKEHYSKLISEGDYFKPEYYQRRYPKVEAYIDSFNFSTYALLDAEGEWHEPGTMGWFGMSSAGPEEQTKFQSEYMQLIQEQDPEDWFVLVDCHI
ncbi:MAG: hypothetical protein IJ086_00270 [Clostridium sp.]|nr:hypothetical protein [Clostridium sp.]